MVRAVQASSPESLHVDAELGAITAAGRVSLESIDSDLRTLREQVGACDSFLHQLTSQGLAFSEDIREFVSSAMVCVCVTLCVCVCVCVLWGFILATRHRCVRTRPNKVRWRQASLRPCTHSVPCWPFLHGRTSSRPSSFKPLTASSRCDRMCVALAVVIHVSAIPRRRSWRRRRPSSVCVRPCKIRVASALRLNRHVGAGRGARRAVWWSSCCLGHIDCHGRRADGRGNGRGPRRDTRAFRIRPPVCGGVGGRGPSCA